MFKTYKTTRTITKKGSQNTGEQYDSLLNQTKRILFRTIFALALALKVTPKKLTKAFDVDKVDDYALKFRDELDKKAKAEVEKMIKKMKKEK